MGRYLPVAALTAQSACGTPITETLEATLEAHMDNVLSVAFSPDGTLLASGSDDGLVGLWDTHTETLQATLGHESPVLSVAFSPDSDLLATGSTDGVARLWDPHVPEHKAALGHESPVESVAFDGSTYSLPEAKMAGFASGRLRPKLPQHPHRRHQNQSVKLGIFSRPGRAALTPTPIPHFPFLTTVMHSWTSPDYPRG